MLIGYFLSEYVGKVYLGPAEKLRGHNVRDLAVQHNP